MTPYLIRSPFSLVIPEGRSRESVVSFGPLFRNDGSPTETLGDDGNKTQQKGCYKNWGHPELAARRVSGSTAWAVCRVVI